MEVDVNKYDRVGTKEKEKEKEEVAEKEKEEKEKEEWGIGRYGKLLSGG